MSYLTRAFMDEFEPVLRDKPNAKVYDIEPRIRMLTETTPCPRPCSGGAPPIGCAFVDWIPDDAGTKAAVMLSYKWGYEVRQIVDALCQYCRKHQLDPAFALCGFAVSASTNMK